MKNMVEVIEQFAKDCAKLPGPLKQWAAYKELKQEIDDMNTLLVETFDALTIKATIRAQFAHRGVS